MATWLRSKGLTEVHGQQHGGGHNFPFGRLKLTLAFHGSALPEGSYGGNPCGLHLFLNDGIRIYDAADTALFGDMRLFGEEGIDLAILPIGDNFAMGPDDALRAVKLLGPKKVIPIQYDTWELIAQDARQWKVLRPAPCDKRQLGPARARSRLSLEVAWLRRRPARRRLPGRRSQRDGADGR
ncbi:MAG: MBL fold metallo-hydrolase, partial [Singulisphaera sp.]